MKYIALAAEYHQIIRVKRIGLFFRVCNDPSVTEWWPWTKPGYITTTRRQSNNQWSGGIVALRAPKNSECKNPLEMFSPRFSGSRQHPPHWFSSKGPNSQRGVLPISVVGIERYFKEKRHGNFTTELFLHDNSRAHRALATHNTLAYLGFQFLDHSPYSSDLDPSDYHLFHGLKNNWKVAIFLPTRRSLPPRRLGWTDKFLNFFWVACKS